MDNFSIQGARWDQWAPHYDTDTQGQDPGPAVAALADLAGEGPALELGVGTGRVAVLLATWGTTVVGIDASPEMLRLLGERTEGLPVTGVCADMAAFDLGSQRFKVIYVVASSFFLLPTQELQLQCFATVARHLAEDGVFVLEAAMPLASGLAGPREQMVVREISDEHLKFSAFMHDPVAQLVRAQEVRMGGTPDEWRALPNTMRYAFPSELDLMAQIAGLRLRDRWGDWQGNPLRPAGTHHVSVYTPQTRAADTVTSGAPA
ncbi:class I SAM-dependent DNA methyltransferase [Streptomyces sp. Midd1]|uniref:class I SAM-dependent DNA methyltransferase n=1 Tax=Streptomyces sp. Midd3 TaxID=3161191 RepID=UPI0034DB346B